VQKNKLNILNNLVSYSFFNIIDKGLIFLGPFFILFLSSDTSLFNDIEYIFSLASILIIFFDFGIKNYLFYGYKINKNKSKYLKETKAKYNSLIILYLFFLIIAVIAFRQINFIGFFVLIRSLITLILTFYANYYRLIDKPSYIFFFSIPINIIVYIYTFYLFVTGTKITLFNFYLIPLLAIIIFCFNSLKNKKLDLKLSSLISKSTKYTLPIMINLLFVGTMNHFGKIYAYNFLDSEDMFQIASIQRIATIITLFHISFMGFFSKHLFISNIKKEHQKIFSFYLICLMTIGLLIFMLSLMFSSYLQLNRVPILFFIIGTLFLCINSYFEIYFNLNNINKYIPLISLGSFLIYFIIFFNLPLINITNISLVYLLSNFAGFLLVIFFIKKIKNLGRLDFE